MRQAIGAVLRDTIARVDRYAEESPVARGSVASANERQKLLSDVHRAGAGKAAALPICGCGLLASPTRVGNTDDWLHFPFAWRAIGYLALTYAATTAIHVAVTVQVNRRARAQPKQPHKSANRQTTIGCEDRYRHSRAKCP